MFDIKKLAAGIIAGAAITAAPIIAFAAPASAATNAANPVVAAAPHARVVSSAEAVQGSGQNMLGDRANALGDTNQLGANNQLGAGRDVLGASHATPCGGGINCR